MCFSHIFVRAPNPHPKYRPLHWPCTNELPRKDDKAGINGRLPTQKCFKLNMHLKTNSPLSVATQLNSWLFYLLDLFSCEYFVGCVFLMGLSDPFKEYRFTCFQLIEKQVQDWQEPKKGCNLIPRTSSQMPNAFLAYVFRPKHLYYNDHMLASGRPCPATKMFDWIPVATSVQKLVSLTCSWQADDTLHRYRIHP